MSATKFDLNDWCMDNGGTGGLLQHLVAQISEASLVPAPPPQPVAEGPHPPPPQQMPELVNGRPVHLATADLNRLAKSLRDHFLSQNQPPMLFLRDGRVTRLAKRSGSTPRLETVTTEAMHAGVVDAATWVRHDDKTGGWKPAHPPHDLSNMLVSLPDQRLPTIEYVADTPFFDQNGVLCESEGYHEHPQCYLHKNGLSYDPAPTSPSNEELAASIALLDDIVCDFPWAKPSDKTHYFASILVPFVRPIIQGCTPISLIEAPSHGAGKGLLSDVLSLICTGHLSHPTTLGRDDESTEKRITAMLAEGPSLITIDNVSERVLMSSGNIAAAVTADRWKQRKLGGLEMLTLPNRALWVMTGANPNLTREITRRCIRVRIDPGTDRPEDRTGFKYSDLRGHVRSIRGPIVRAVITIVRRWLAAGRPAPVNSQPLGSFESWSRVVGGILEAAGIGHFLEDRDEMYAANDVEGAEWFSFVCAWSEQHGCNQVTAAQLMPLASEHLGGVLGEGSTKSQTSKLGRALVRMRDKYFGNIRIRRVGTEARPAWVVTIAAPVAIQPHGAEQSEPGELG